MTQQFWRRPFLACRLAKTWQAFLHEPAAIPQEVAELGEQGSGLWNVLTTRPNCAGHAETVDLGERGPIVTHCRRTTHIIAAERNCSEPVCKAIDDPVCAQMDGVPCAFRLGFTYRQKFYGWKVVHDPRLADFSPGFLVTGKVIENLIAEDYTEMNFMAGDYPGSGPGLRWAAGMNHSSLPVTGR